MKNKEKEVIMVENESREFMEARAEISKLFDEVIAESLRKIRERNDFELNDERRMSCN